jgi:beta-lactam-binding protein with PASTA domain
MQLEHGEAPPARRTRTGLASLLDRDWLFALSLAFAVGVLVWFARAIADFFGPSTAMVMIPSFPGQTQDDAQSECTHLHLRCAVIASQPSERYPKGVVMSQQPGPGTRVREGRQVSLIVSTGVTIFPMPDLRYESLRNAGFDLNRLKLQLGPTQTVVNNDVPANYVVAQDPPPLTSVRQGSRVTLTLSKGPPPAVKVPVFTGMQINDARDLAQRANVHLGQILWTPFGVSAPPRGTVMRQNPAPNTDIDSFQEVSLQVSAGPGVYGYLVRQTHASVTVPARQDAAQVRVEVRDETGTWNVYDGYAQGGQKLDFTVTAVGTAELDTYINNELVNQSMIGKEPPLPSPKPTLPGRKKP